VAGLQVPAGADSADAAAGKAAMGLRRQAAEVDLADAEGNQARRPVGGARRPQLVGGAVIRGFRT
jgi:hypothetical protein